MFDVVVVGSGFAGSVLAERLSNVLRKRVLIIEKRPHIGGNSYDYYNEEGLLVHKYGPHVFRTNSKEVFEYLSKFTEWIPYQHKVLANINGTKVPVPFNLNSLYKLFPAETARSLELKLVKHFGYGTRIPILKLKKVADELGDKDLKSLANFVYEKVYLNYTLKQWEESPEELIGVLDRVPVVLSRDNRYFNDKYQAMPKYGYTTLFYKMLLNPNIKILLNTDYKEVLEVDIDTGEVSLFGKPWKGILIYTGPIDYFFDYEFGELPYRSLEFKFETYNVEYFLDAAVENYPNEYDFTRITEFKRLTFQKHPKTTVAYEYPRKYIPSKNEPYYPIPRKENLRRYQLYNERARLLNNKSKTRFIFIGRLAEYKYYTMSDVIQRALDEFKKLMGANKI
ncbi:UDP-galactopyranose mutase [Thermococcus peptonophilus]|uniref:UDP-galactopyranose mutase n=1 Tax=Thermococcus peptonophilus TaxID=53952 RepID=A0A142CVQ2_9EURY|nr:UDP-galactopyranose mutase [Thermococcus peptonophilus]AMQ18854.1 UDP-galactopyranose mutase [Thermococcus peptonophilus]